MNLSKSKFVIYHYPFLNISFPKLLHFRKLPPKKKYCKNIIILIPKFEGWRTDLARLSQ